MSGAVKAGAGAAAVALALSCCTETREGLGYRPAPPRPRPAQPAPPGARADAVVLNVDAAPIDTDGNGYPDLIRATAHLFDTRYAPPMYEDGAFVFLLYPPGGAAQPGSPPLRQWRFDQEKLAEARGRSRFGECYRFRLSLLEGGGDAMNVSMADVVCRFEPADGGEPARAGGVATIQLGRRVLLP